MSRRRVPLHANPDQPHAYQPRKVTNRGEPLWTWRDIRERGIGTQWDPPCRHCGSESGRHDLNR